MSLKCYGDASAALAQQQTVQETSAEATEDDALHHQSEAKHLVINDSFLDTAQELKDHFDSRCVLGLSASAPKLIDDCANCHLHGEIYWLICHTIVYSQKHPGLRPHTGHLSNFPRCKSWSQLLRPQSKSQAASTLWWQVCRSSGLGIRAVRVGLLACARAIHSAAHACRALLSTSTVSSAGGCAAELWRAAAGVPQLLPDLAVLLRGRMQTGSRSNSGMMLPCSSIGQRSSSPTVLADADRWGPLCALRILSPCLKSC